MAKIERMVSSIVEKARALHKNQNLTADNMIYADQESSIRTLEL